MCSIAAGASTAKDEKSLMHILVQMSKLSPAESLARLPPHPRKEVRDQMEQLVAKNNKIVEYDECHSVLAVHPPIYSVQVVYVTPHFHVETKYITYTVRMEKKATNLK